MNQKDFEEAMEWLEFADTREWHCVEQIECIMDGLDVDLAELTIEQEETLKKRLLECKENMMGEWSGWRWVLQKRKQEKIPRSRFWWYIDKL